jgi:hypothetical protein
MYAAHFIFLNVDIYIYVYIVIVTGVCQALNFLDPSSSVGEAFSISLVLCYMSRDAYICFRIELKSPPQ